MKAHLVPALAEADFGEGRADPLPPDRVLQRRRGW